jgi:hypothetical protein
MKARPKYMPCLSQEATRVTTFFHPAKMGLGCLLRSPLYMVAKTSPDMLEKIIEIAHHNHFG